jgi:hypothetical protein
VAVQSSSATTWSGETAVRSGWVHVWIASWWPDLKARFTRSMEAWDEMTLAPITKKVALTPILSR